MSAAMRGLEVPEPSEDFTADPVELFFDLAEHVRMEIRPSKRRADAPALR